MKKQRLIIAQVILLLIVAVFSIVAGNIKSNKYLEAGAFGNTAENTDFSHLADKLYGILG